MSSDITWPQAGGDETLHAITLSSGETFVRPDWDAYAMGYSACRDDARRLAAAMLEDWSERGYAMPGEDWKGEELINAIDALPPKAVFDEDGLPVEDDDELSPGKVLFPGIERHIDNYRVSLHTTSPKDDDAPSSH